MSHDSSIQLLFLGTGTSTTLPLTPCLTLSCPYPEQFTSHVPLPAPSTDKGAYNPKGEWPSNIPCACCRNAVDPDVPEGWKNKRGNTSVVVRKKSMNGEWRNLVVDVGKSFTEQARRFFPRWGVKTIDAVLLTHGHADAYFGLDDLREWCIRQRTQIPIYLDQATYEVVAASFPYLVDKTKASGGGDIPTLTWHIINDESFFEPCGIRVQSLAVHHGVYFTAQPSPPRKPQSMTVRAISKPGSTASVKPKPLICLAFMFDESVVYIGDVSEIPERTWERLLNRTPSPKKEEMNGSTPDRSTGNDIPQVDGASSLEPIGQPDSKSALSRLPVLIIDALWPLRPHFSHFSLSQALTAVLRLRPHMTYLIGSTHPTTHFMWEEICLSFRALDGRRDHPDSDVTKSLVKRVWASQDIAAGLGEEVKQAGLRVEPAWDGLALQVGEDAGEDGWMKVDGPGGSAGGWGI